MSSDRSQKPSQEMYLTGFMDNHLWTSPAAEVQSSQHFSHRALSLQEGCHTLVPVSVSGQFVWSLSRWPPSWAPFQQKFIKNNFHLFF